MQMSGGLRKIGLRKGDRVGLISHNCPEWGITYLAILAAGGVAVPLDSSWKTGEISRAIGLSGIKILFCSAKCKPTAGEGAEQVDPNLRIIIMDSSNDIAFRSLTESPPFVCDEVSPDDPASIIYTSGTSGDPKGVVLTHRNITSDLEGITGALEFYPSDKFLSVLPLHHTFETTCGLLTPLLLDCKSFTRDRLSRGTSLRIFEITK